MCVEQLDEEHKRVVTDRVVAAAKLLWLQSLIGPFGYNLVLP